MKFSTGGFEGMRMQSNGKLFVNHTETISDFNLLQVELTQVANMVVHGWFKY